MPKLTVESGPLQGQVFSFEGAAVIGRGQLVDVRLDDVAVSRRHAEVRAVDDGFELVDLGSANGTSHNGATVSGRVPLADGDKLEIGQSTLRFEFARRAADAAPMPSAVSGQRLYLEVLARITMLCRVAHSAEAQSAPDVQLAAALDALLEGLPGVERVSLWSYVAAGDQFAVTLARAHEGSDAREPSALAPLLREILHHRDGLFVLEKAARDTLAQRLKLDTLAGQVVVLPLRAGGELFGAMLIEASDDPPALRASDREVLLAAAAMIALLQSIVRGAARDKEIEGHDLQLARRIQQRFLPQSPPQLAGYSFVDSYTAARVIGGDHYDFVPLADGRIAIVVADVSGKAVSGALYMARLGLHLRIAGVRSRNPAELLTAANTALYAELESGMFVTMLAGALDARSGKLELSSAGHPPPLVRRRDGRLEPLDAPGGPPLGAMSQPIYHTALTTLAAGDCVLFFTDGLDEAHNAQSELFGIERVAQAMVKSGDAAKMIENLLGALGEFVGAEPQHDDLTLVALERK
jgi:serine phosphatase RsbU (regulator of sigma subunit)